MKTSYFCKDCKYSFIAIKDQIIYAFSDSPMRYSCKKDAENREESFNPVTGRKVKAKIKYEYCWVARLKNGYCGEEAKYWAPKNKKDLFRALIK